MTERDALSDLIGDIATECVNGSSGRMPFYPDVHPEPTAQMIKDYIRKLIADEDQALADLTAASPVFDRHYGARAALADLLGDIDWIGRPGKAASDV